MKNDLKLGGEFRFQQIRDGEVVDEGLAANLFVNEGLVYALNSAFADFVGGAPTPIGNFYIGLAQANRTWQASDSSATIHTVSTEFELYDEATRGQWAPQQLAIPGTIELSDSGAEATFTIGDLSGVGGQATIYGAFLISSNTKDGSSDSGSTLVAGSNFTSPRVVFQSDVFKIGYILRAQSV